MKCQLIVVLLAVASGVGPRADAAGEAGLRATFDSPPEDARPIVRWWWFGPAVTKPELKREIDAMKAGGFGGFEVQPTYPLAVDGQPAGLVNLRFMSPAFLEDLNFVASAAKDAGMGEPVLPRRSTARSGTRPSSS